MAIVTRYFSTSGAGADDGTSWANRTTLISGGTWSSVITGFSFAGSDSLLCLIGPGTHTVTGTLPTVAPTDANPLTFHGCDSSGVPLTPPDPDWVSAAAPWDDSGLPLLSASGNIFVTDKIILYRLIKVTSSGVTASPIATEATYDWCSLTNSVSNSSAKVLQAGNHAQNCLIYMTGTAWNAAVECVASGVYVNLRLIGITGSTGDRDGFDIGNTANSVILGCTAVDFGGKGLSASGGTAAFATILKSSFINNGGAGIELNATASQTLQHRVIDCLCTGNGGWGIDCKVSHVWLANNRTRDNTSGGTTGNANYSNFSEYTTDTDDATEFVNSGSDDYRIDNAAATFGLNHGAGDGPAAGGGAAGVIKQVGDGGGMVG